MAALGHLPPRGKSGLPETTVPGNARAGQPDGKRHRKETASPLWRFAKGCDGVRMKRWGKSPPHRWQQGWHGKPHREQCQIGPPRGQVGQPKPPLGMFHPREAGLAARDVRQRASQKNGHRTLSFWGRGNKIRLIGSLRKTRPLGARRYRPLAREAILTRAAI